MQVMLQLSQEELTRYTNIFLRAFLKHPSKHYYFRKGKIASADLAVKIKPL